MTRGCLVADDHPALLSAVSDYLTDHGFDVVGACRDGDRALATAAERRPALALVDYRMPRVAGADLVRALRERSPHTRVAVYTADADDAVVRDAIAAGADAVVLKEAPLADLVRALEALLEGRAYLDPGLAQPRSTAAQLTPRELDVLRLVADGRSHAQIAAQLGIGVETARTHLKNACDRLRASNRTHAVATAIRAGVL